jgi:hypothetical protein
MATANSVAITATGADDECLIDMRMILLDDEIVHRTGQAAIT